MKSMPRAVKLLLAVLAGFLTLAAAGALVVGAAYLYFGPQLPEPGDIGIAKLNEPLRVFAADGRLIGEFGTERRLPMTYEQIPPLVVQAFLAAEDDRFFQHPGVDYQGILRAVWHLVLTGNKTQGGSTITMQLARNLYLSNARTYTRKIKEIFLALRIESKLTKQQILEIYLNKIYLGHRAYGVGAAAQVYYNKKLKDLDVAQVAMIAGLPKAPSRYNPLVNPERAVERRNYVLRRMLELGDIDKKTYADAIAEQESAGQVTTDGSPGAKQRRDARYEADYVAEMVRQVLYKRFGEATYTEGYQVTTTIDSDRQRAANRALRRGLLAYDERHKWRGAEAELSSSQLADTEAMDAALADRPGAGGLVVAVVTGVEARKANLHTEKYGQVSLTAANVSWIKRGQPLSDLIKRGDVVRLAYTGNEKAPWALAQIPKVQGALVAINPDDGAIEALVGGFDFSLSKFNRAIQARRQPGSAIKPFVYSSALANGYTTASIINDAPVVFDDPGLDKSWRPQNYSGRVYGPTRLREGLVHSRNLVSIRLMRAVGLDTARNFMSSKFGLPKDRMPRDLSLALGSATFSPLQMARGYSVFANGGYLVKPFFIKEIRDGQGNVIEEHKPQYACPKSDCSKLPEGEDAAPETITPENAYLMTSMMQDVIKRGTGVRAKVLNRSDIAGKTGTTNDQIDAWFAGFNHKLVTICWVGFDKLKPLGHSETGSHAALPVWVDFMRSALKGTPESQLPRPSDLVTVRINKETGLLAVGDSGDTMFETFRSDHIPPAGQPAGSDGFDNYGDQDDPNNYGSPPARRGGEVEQLF